MSLNIIPELKDFFVELQKWLDSGCPVDGPFANVFSKRLTICGCWLRWCRTARYHNLQHIYGSGRLQLSILFTSRYGHGSYPFQDKHLPKTHYVQEVTHGIVWENPRRLAFVKEMSS